MTLTAFPPHNPSLQDGEMHLNEPGTAAGLL